MKQKITSRNSEGQKAHEKLNWSILKSMQKINADQLKGRKTTKISSACVQEQSNTNSKKRRWLAFDLMCYQLSAPAKIDA